MRERGLSASSTRAAHGLVRRALADAVRHQLVARNVAFDHGPPSVEPAERVFAPNADQVAALLAKLDGDPWRVPVIVALYCGLRRGEQLALRWSNVDLDRGPDADCRSAGAEQRRGQPEAAKTAAGTRTISLPAIVVEALREHRKAAAGTCLAARPRAPVRRRSGVPGRSWQASGAARVLTALDATDGPSGNAGHHLAQPAPRARFHADRGRRARSPRSRNGSATPNPMVTLKIYAHLFDRDDRGAADAIDRMLRRAEPMEWTYEDLEGADLGCGQGAAGARAVHDRVKR